MLSRGEKARLRGKKGLAAQYAIFALLYAYNQRRYSLHIFVSNARISEVILKLLREAGVAFPTRFVSQGPWQVYSHGPYHAYDYMLPGPVTVSPVSLDISAVSEAHVVDLTAE